MTPEDEFLSRWNAEKASYAHWGALVGVRIRELASQYFDPRGKDHLFRAPLVPRVKTDESLVQKAFKRNKQYSSPYDDIEDKVGIRAVVLLESEVRVLGELISKDSTIWTAIKARDHEVEIAASPYEFGYQSLHYIVRSEPGQSYLGEAIPAGLPCEIQVRTLLQHAYSELTHDTLYKPSITATPIMKRAAAKSMALIEATGDYFTKLDELIHAEVQPLRTVGDHAEDAYRRIVEREPTGTGTPLSDLILDRYGKDVDLVAFGEWVRQKSFLGRSIAERAESNSVFRIPNILLAYYSASTARHSTPYNSPIPEADLAAIYSDLGDSLTG